jgi:hypothetical protein
MMRVRIFADARPGKVEEQINHWFENEAGEVYVVKTETVAVVAERRDSESSPFIIVTIWYERD